MARKRKVGRPRLSAAQKAKNAAEAKIIKAAYKKLEYNVHGVKYTTFKREVLQYRGKTYKGKKMYLSGAIKRVSGSVKFTPPDFRNYINLYEGIKIHFAQEYKEILKFSVDSNGDRINPAYITTWDEEEDVYIIKNGKGKKLQISMDDSPATIDLKYL